MRPSQVLDCQADLLVRLDDQMFRDAVGKSADLDLSNATLTEQEKALNAEASVSSLRNTVRVAYPFKVEHDMTFLVEFAASQLDATDKFDKNLAPTQAGMCFFERSLKCHDVRGGIMKINWLVWGPCATEMGPATLLWMFNDMYIDPDQFNLSEAAKIWKEQSHSHSHSQKHIDDALRRIGRWGHAALDIAFQGQSIGPAQLTPSQSTIDRLLADDGVVAQVGDNPTRWVHALWLLLGQTITRTESEPVDRATTRRMRRMNLPQRVTTVSLRRVENAHRADGETMVEWSHRWVVRGHWAWRHCSEHHPHAQPYKDGWGTRNWIAPYVKGPDDKPFVTGHEVVSVFRR